jgi:hypothetical protein
MGSDFSVLELTMARPAASNQDYFNSGTRIKRLGQIRSRFFHGDAGKKFDALNACP